VPTDNTQAFYDGVEGCGIQCQNPLLTEDEHRQIHQLVAWAGTICLLFNLFTVVSYNCGVLSLVSTSFCMKVVVYDEITTCQVLIKFGIRWYTLKVVGII
jgi:hypothetical protein